MGGDARLALRVAAVSAPPALLSLALAWPTLWPEPQRIDGIATPVRVCAGPVCGDLVALDGRTLACRLDLIGLPSDCRLRRDATGARLDRLAGGQAVQATVLPMPSLLGLVGRPAADGLLLTLEHDGQRLFTRTLSQHAWQALYGNWLFHAVYWPVVGLLLWLAPRSRLARRLWARATWSDDRR